MKGPLLWPMTEGRDGKTYPGARLTPAELSTMVEIVHHLNHVCGYTQLEIGEYLSERGAPRSRGSIGRYLALPCGKCPDHGMSAVNDLGRSRQRRP